MNIHTTARAAATTAEQAFITQHGEPMYCGFAWVNVRCAKGNTKLGKLQRAELEANGFRKSYTGGMDLWSAGSYNGQSMDIKEEGARAYAEVLRANGMDAYMMSRAD
jgi:hypothetical protein